MANKKIGKGTKILGIAVGILVVITIIGITYESMTGVDTITGERKTTGIGSEKWEEESVLDTEKVVVNTPKIIQNQCDSSYPSICIAPYPPDLNCGDIPYTNFTVLQPDPHGFDRDKDGIGCES